MTKLKHLEALGRIPMFITKKEDDEHQYKCVEIAQMLASAKTEIEKRAIWKIFIAA